MSPQTKVLLAIAILSVALALTVATLVQCYGINIDDFKDNSTSLDESAGNISTKYAQEEEIHTLSTDSKINDLIGMVNTTNTRLDMLTTSQANPQARFDQLEASIKAAGKLARNASMATQQKTENSYFPFTDSQTDVNLVAGGTGSSLRTSQTTAKTKIQHECINVPVHSQVYPRGSWTDWFEKSWYEAFADCRARGMDLASIESEEEYHRVMEKVTSIGERPENVDFWISGKLQSDEGRFKWMSNNHTVTYNKWYTDQPKQNEVCGSKPDFCIEINQIYGNKWNDFCCSHPQYYICQSEI